MTTIKPLEGRTVHQIQSGQVIVDLCSVAKELVENSLDAGATAIDVRFKSNGLDSIEVQDNGAGISNENFETVALKHYTSKLTNYDDLTSLQTFGFRGEALSSLCALSNFHIITAQAEDAPKGTRLDFEISGKLSGTQVVASQKGTTISVENLFRNLPVRRRELEKNIKREYGKVLTVLQAYACISTQVKFSVSNVMANGRKAVVFATKSNPTTRENIANVFGAKVLPCLTSMALGFAMQPSGNPLPFEQGADRDSDKQVRIVGHVSRPVFGEGRQTPDRQMFFVNGRPCGLPQLAKIFNEVYKSYNLSQSPFIFANIILDTNAYDVNVSPDKRTILLHDQGALLESLRTSLTELFEKQDQTVPQIQRSQQKLPLFKQLTVQRETSTAGSADEERDESSSSETPNNQSAAYTEPAVDEAENVTWSAKPSLIEGFAGRDTRERARVSNLAAGMRNGSESLSKDKQKLVNRLSRSEDRAGGTDESDRHPDPGAPNATRTERSIPVLDFNKRLAEQEAASNVVDSQASSSSEANTEADIPAITSTPTKHSPGVVQNAFDRMRPQRTPTQIATITIGDKTTTSVLGPTVSKRQKVIPSPRVSAPSQGSALEGFSSSMRSFAAPGTVAEDVDVPPTHSSEPEETGDSRYGASSDESDVEDAGKLTPFHKHEELQSAADVTDVEDESIHRSNEEESDEDYLDEEDSKIREDAKVAALIQQAEQAAAVPSQDNIRRANKLLKGSKQKESTTQLIQIMEDSVQRIEKSLLTLKSSLQNSLQNHSTSENTLEADSTSPEDHLSLKVSKEDFSRMHIVGQFNLGFILAVRPSHSHSPTTSDELFIIDQHASDEKYNFERLQSTTIVQNQRVVRPHPLNLTAIEEEIILEHNTALVRNGFQVDIDTTGNLPIGQRCKLVSLPMSRDVTFDTSDLEELIALLADLGVSGSTALQNIPRPTKVRKMFAMRACRSSVMIGKSLSLRQMERLVRKMGEVDKPWNCPHGRPTMRHVLGLGAWRGWVEGDGVVGLGGWEEGERKVDWRGWIGGVGARGGDGEEDMEDEDGVEMRGEADGEEASQEDDEEESEEMAGPSEDDDVEEEEEEEEEESIGPSRLNLLGRFGSTG